MNLRTLMIGGHAVAGASVAVAIWTGCAVAGLARLNPAALSSPAAAAACGPGGGAQPRLARAWLWWTVTSR
jgi:hypothetical protein